jgi:DNA polymerase (family 10)
MSDKPQQAQGLPYRFSNKDVADLLAGVGARLQVLDANRFRVQAYTTAAENIRHMAQDVGTLYAQDALDDIPGVGAGIAALLRELFENGRVAEFEELKEQVPEGVVAMMQVPELGPKKAKRLWEELNVLSVADLKAAAEAGKLADMKGFGAKTQDRILRNIELLEKRSDARTPLGVARPLALSLLQGLENALEPRLIRKIEVGGSLRRWQETIGDVDLVCVSDDPAAVMAAFRALPQVVEVIGSGETKTSVLLGNGLQVDLRVVEEKHWGAALQYFTGNKEHNIEMREIALRQGWSLNEYGLTATGDGKEPAGTERFFAEEADLYAFLGLAWMAPEIRQNRGEIAAARSRKLPDLVELGDIRGELHGHTTWSDGQGSVAEMAAAALARGYDYWNVSDHSVGLGVVQGVDGARLQKQAEEIDAVNRRMMAEGKAFRLLQGSEVEILADGTLGLPDEVMAGLDVVVASIHSAQRQERETITARCLKAVYNPHVDILGHPTSRLIGQRPPTELDVERVLRACVETGAVVEINAHPSRLDLNDVWARRAVELGCKIAINCDAHEVRGMEVMEYGIGTARRGWVTAADVVNTRPLGELLALLKDGRSVALSAARIEQQ